MPDPFTNARPYLDPTFPTSGDGFSISGFKRQLQALAFLDMIPLQPRAHNPADNKIMVRGRDASGYFNPVYYGSTDQRVAFGSGDSPAFATPASSPRIDIVYVTPSGDIRIKQGTPAASPILPGLGTTSGDIPVCAVWNRPSQTKIVNFEDKDSNTGDGYIYQDLRPFLSAPLSGGGGGGASLASSAPLSATGDNAVGVGTTAARADHTHQGVHSVKIVGSGDNYGDMAFAGPTLSQGAGTIIVNVKVSFAQRQDFVNSMTPNITIDNTIPQITEGTEILSVLHTPISASNILNIRVNAMVAVSAAGTMVLALFKDSVSNAIATAELKTTNDVHPIMIDFWMVAGTTSAIRFSARIGADAVDVILGGKANAPHLGGTLSSTIVVTEYAR